MRRRKQIFTWCAAVASAGFLVLADAASGFAAADARQPTPAAGRIGAGFATLTSAQLASMLRRKDFYFVNVHIPYEGEIRNTDAFIPFNRIAENLGRLPNKNARIVLYCRTGRMSEIAARELARLGYRRVSHLAGGMVAWERSGYKLLRR